MVRENYFDTVEPVPRPKTAAASEMVQALHLIFFIFVCTSICIYAVT